MSDLDKDIEIIKENFDLTMYEKTNNVCKILDENRGIFPPEFIEDLIYIVDKLVHKQLKPTQLTVCETLIERQKYEIQKAIDERNEKRIEFLSSELETYKNIAEKLSEKLNQSYFEENDFMLFFEKEILKGEKADYGYVGGVIIDWARKEVEKDD